MRAACLSLGEIMSNIKLKKLSFSNLFSYGENNVIHFDKTRMTQLTAPNGSGKSSIALILQETLFNKNIKGIKKNDLLNRWSKSKSWESKLEFSVNTNEYIVSVKRTGATTKVLLVENDIDISDHKVLDTYKKIQNILGVDFEIFSQLTYQSSIDLLDFLKATDTNRKKFLINLFNLEKYVNIGDTIKIKFNSIDRDSAKTAGEMKSINDFLDNVTIPSKQKEEMLPAIDESLQQQVGVLDEQIRNHEQICKKIDKNNMHISERQNLRFMMKMPIPAKFEKTEIYEKNKQDLLLHKNELARLKKELDSIDDRDTCPACGQAIDNVKARQMKVDLKNRVYLSESNVRQHTDYIQIVEDEIRTIQRAQRVYDQNQKAIEDFEQLTQLIDPDMQKDYPNIDDIKNKRNALLQEYKTQKEKYDQVVNFNKQVGVTNAKILALEEQREDFLNRQNVVKNATIKLTKSLNNLNILKKAFSTSGIVAFKLENLTKELQNTINHYLSLLSDGQFQIRFALNKEKLNIVVINNGEATPIETVSGGEFSRIQTAILLAIRNLLSKLGGSSINLLFLDEITGVLDDEGKDKLIEVLRTEDELNVFLISHDFTHPLVEKVHINKDKNISHVRS